MSNHINTSMRSTLTISYTGDPRAKRLVIALRNWIGQSQIGYCTVSDDGESLNIGGIYGERHFDDIYEVAATILPAKMPPQNRNQLSRSIAEAVGDGKITSATLLDPTTDDCMYGFRREANVQIQMSCGGYLHIYDDWCGGDVEGQCYRTQVIWDTPDGSDWDGGTCRAMMLPGDWTDRIERLRDIAVNVAAKTVEQ